MASSGTQRWEHARLALSAFTRQVLLRPARIGSLAGLGALILVVVMRGNQWWILLGVLLFQVSAVALTAMWVDVGQLARARRFAAASRLDPLNCWSMPDHLDVFLPQQRCPRRDR